jgi:hypothetical protein
MIHWLAGESSTFHELTACKFILCASESFWPKRKLPPPKLLFYQKLSVSLIYLLAYSQQPVLVLVYLDATYASASIS